MANLRANMKRFKEHLWTKRLLIREYKETGRPMGVYCIKNALNGKLLVGKSIDLPSILNRQRAQLRSGSHPNPTLQKDLVEYGAEAFEVEVLDTLELPDQADYDPSADLRTIVSGDPFVQRRLSSGPDEMEHHERNE